MDRFPDADCDRIVEVFRNAGMMVEYGVQYSVKGQIAQLLNGVKTLESNRMWSNARLEKLIEDLQHDLGDGLTVIAAIKATDPELVKELRSLL